MRLLFPNWMAPNAHLTMINIVLYEPEIPPNTGNIIRLCANTGMRLHLIEPIAFDMDDKKLRRAGLDYHEFSSVAVYANLDDFLENNSLNQIYAISTKGSRSYTDVKFAPNDAVIFGPETRGLPANVRDQFGKDNCLRIPMLPDSRSLNLSNSAAIIVYEAWRQLGFEDSV